GDLWLAQLMSQFARGYSEPLSGARLHRLPQNRTVVHDQSILTHFRLEGGERRTVHSNEDIRRVHERSPDLSLREDDVTMGSTATHFGAIRGKPADVIAFFHSRGCQHDSQRKNSLSTKTGDLEACTCRLASRSLH